MGGNYYPSIDSPVDGSTYLTLIEEQLHLQYRKVKVSTTAGVTTWKIQVPSLYVPDSQTPPALPTSVPADDPKNDYPATADHYILASDTELAIALAGAVQSTLDSADSIEIKKQKLFSLTNEIGKYKKASVGKVVKNATMSILNSTFANEADRVAALESFTSGAVQADPTKAAAVVATMIPLVVPKVVGYKKVGTSYVTNPSATNTAGGVFAAVPSFADAADEIVSEAVKQAAVNAVAIVNSALGSVAQIVDVSGGATGGQDPVGNGSATKAKQIIQGITAAAVNTAYANGAGYLGDEVAVAIGTKVKALVYTHKAGTNVKTAIATSADVASAIFASTATNRPSSLKEISLIAAGLFKGFRGSLYEADPSGNIVGSIKTAYGYANDSNEATYLTQVRGGFLDASIATPNDKVAVANAVLAQINNTNINYVTARLTGAAASLPALVAYAPSGDTGLGSFVGSILEKDSALGGLSSVSDILEAAVRGNQASAATIAKLAAKWSVATGTTAETHRLGQIVQGAGLGLTGQPLYNTTYGAVISSVISATPLQKETKTITRVNDDNINGALLKTPVKLVTLNTDSQNRIKEIVSYALAGAQNAEAKTAALQSITKAASSGVTYQFYKPILDAAISTAVGSGQTLDVVDQWRAVVTVLASKKLSATLEFAGTYDTSSSPTHTKPTGDVQSLLLSIPAYVKALSGYSASNNDAAIDQSTALINNLQLAPKAIFNKSYEAFAGTGVNSDASGNTPLALITSVGLVSPTSATVAAALAVKLTNVSDATIISTAKGTSPSNAAKIKMAVDVGRYVKTTPGDMFDYLDQQIYQNPTLLNEIVTGATIVAPQYTHIVASAVGFKAPTKVASVVAQLFNYSHITSSDGGLAPLAGSYDNRVDATSAITAATISGILSAKTGLKTGSSAAVVAANELKNVKAAVTALVKQVIGVTGNTPVNSIYLPTSNANLATTGNMSYVDTGVGGGEGTDNFLQSDGSTPTVSGGHLIGGFTRTTQKGEAGVVTGFMTQIIKSSDTTLPNGATGLAGAVLTAAVTVVKADVTKILAIAQAAAQAARSISAGFSATGESDIVTAVLNTFLKKVGSNFISIDDPLHPNYVGFDTLANGKPNPYFGLKDKVTNAVRFGVLAAADNIPGAGAAGVINYTVSYNSPLNSPVTNIMDL